MNYLDSNDINKNETFTPPDFAITVLGSSHGIT